MHSWLECAVRSVFVTPTLHHPERTQAAAKDPNAFAVTVLSRVHDSKDERHAPKHPSSRRLISVPDCGRQPRHLQARPVSPSAKVIAGMARGASDGIAALGLMLAAECGIGLFATQPGVEAAVLVIGAGSQGDDQPDEFEATFCEILSPNRADISRWPCCNVGVTAASSPRSLAMECDE